MSDAWYWFVAAANFVLGLFWITRRTPEGSVVSVICFAASWYMVSSEMARRAERHRWRR